MSKKKKKKSAGKVFLIGFGKSLLIIGLLFLTGFASYKVSLFYFNEKGVAWDSKASLVIRELYGSVEVEDISKNLIYSVDKDSGKIKGLVLEIFNTNTGNMDYITIPVSTEITISNELYQKLARADCEAPQIIKISAIHKYFSETAMYEYGELILNDLLGIDIGYYTVMEPKEFRKIFEKTEYKEAVRTEEAAQIQTVEQWILKDTWVNELKAVEKNEKAVKDYIEAVGGSWESNLSVRSRKKYAADYLKWNIDNTYFHTIPGIKEGKSYEAFPEEAKALIQQLLENETYTGSQDRQAGNMTGKDSRDCLIQILNASQINGLAAKYKEMLEQKGYSVESIGNYMGQLQTQSSILVREEACGADLLLYLGNAELTVSEALPEGIDIQIILGTDADN